MDKDQRHVSATEARVHLGELLKSLADGDVVIQKGGMPVAILSAAPRWYSPDPHGRHLPDTREESEFVGYRYERALSKAPEVGGWERAEAAMRAGWADLDADEAVANIYRWREEGGTGRSFSLSAGGSEEEGVDDDGSGEVSGGQRYLHPDPPGQLRVADAPNPDPRA